MLPADLEYLASKTCPVRLATAREMKGTPTRETLFRDSIGDRQQRLGQGGRVGRAADLVGDDRHRFLRLGEG